MRERSRNTQKMIKTAGDKLLWRLLNLYLFRLGLENVFFDRRNSMVFVYSLCFYCSCQLQKCVELRSLGRESVLISIRILSGAGAISCRIKKKMI